MSTSNGYKTKQRDLILNYFIENKSKHVTAEDIVIHLNNEGTSVGKSTVYRCLDKLMEQGAIRKYIIEEGIGACYQYQDENNDCEEHFHLKCIDCGRLIHLQCDYLAEADEHILHHHNFRIDNRKTVLYGHCGKCHQ